jgi:integrase
MDFGEQNSMSIRRRAGSTLWHYDFTVRGNRFRGSCETGDCQTAEIVEAKLKHDILLRSLTGALPEMTVDAALTRYYTEIGQHAATWDDILRYGLKVSAGLGKSTLLSAITPGAIAAYVAKRRARLSNASVNRELGHLRTVLIRARDVWRVSTATIAWKDLMLQESEGRERVLSEDEEDRLFDALRPDFRPLVRFALLTGLRVLDAITLTWDQVDFDSKLIHFRVKSRRPGGKVHVVPMTAEVLAVLSVERGRHAYRVFTYECQRNRHEPHRGGLQRKGKRYAFTQHGWRRAWAEALTAADIKDFRFHDLRHTFGTRLLRSTGNLVTVQRALGHEDIKTTLRYARMQVDDVRLGMEAVEEAASRSRHSGNSEQPKKKGASDA